MAKDEDLNEGNEVVHDEVEIEDFEYDPTTDTFTYPCPCGDEFLIQGQELMDGMKYAKCPSCSLTVLVVYDLNDLQSIIETKSAEKLSSNKKTTLLNKITN